jgi:Ca2+-binding EF-hand superfamily protein
MNITGLGSTSWYTSMRSTTTRTGSTGSQDGSGDSASFSAESLAALMQPPPMTDDLAAKIGAQMQEKDPDLFGQLDSDGDGTLTAAEFEAGKGKAGPPPGGGGPPPEMTDAMAASIGSQMQTDNSTLFSALDTNGDGVLSASELKAGRDQMDGAMETQGKRPPPPPPPSSSADGQSSDGLDEEQIQKLLQKLQDDGWSDVQTNQLSEILNQMFATTG